MPPGQRGRCHGTAWDFLALPRSPRETTSSISASASLIGTQDQWDSATEGQIPKKSDSSSCDSPSPSCPTVILSLPGSTFLILSQSQTFPCKACISPGNLCPTVSHFLPATALESKQTHHAQSLHMLYFFLICFTQVETKAPRRLFNWLKFTHIVSARRKVNRACFKGVKTSNIPFITTPHESVIYNKKYIFLVFILFLVHIS